MAKITKRYDNKKNNNTRKNKNKTPVFPINNFKLVVKDKKIKLYLPSFLSSCFNFYYGNINFNKIINNKTNYSNSFLNVLENGPLIIIDYPNIIHILYEKYKNKDVVFKKFYLFIYNQLLTNAKFYIISKQVNIDNICFNIDNVFNEGYKITGKFINEKYFSNESLNIYELSYKTKISSSIDDLLCYFICFILYVYLITSNVEPNSPVNNKLNKLNIITNDKQFFNKNLFGFTEEERKNHIYILKDLIFEKLSIHNKKFILIKNELEHKLVTLFLNEYIVTKSNDTKNLECKLIILLKILHNSIPTKKEVSFYSYKNINQLQQKYLKFFYKECNGLDNIISDTKSLLKSYYLYLFIKYVQINLHTYTLNNAEYGKLYGSDKKEKIIKLFR
jgi:predicted small secreted protein